MKKIKKHKIMYQIEKTQTGYDLTIKKSKLAFLKAFFTGQLTLNLNKETASSISNALYTPKNKKSVVKKSSL